MRKIGIMGGTFNPIHIGHLALAQRVLDELMLDEIWFVPTGCSYMKSELHVISPEDRLHMAQLAIAGNDKMKCCDIETKRDGYTYTYETLEQLKRSFPEDAFYFIFGADCLFAIETWKYPERILQACTMVAAVRNGISMREMEEKIADLEVRFGARVLLLPFLNLEISSTDLRERIKAGKSVRYLIPDNVIAYIEQMNFYKEET